VLHHDAINRNKYLIYIHIQESLRLQCDVVESRKVGNEQPSKQPLTRSGGFLSGSRSDLLHVQCFFRTFSGCLMAVFAVTRWKISTYNCTNFRAIRSFPGIKSATLTWWPFSPTVRLHRSPYTVEISPLKAREARNISLMRVCHPSPLARRAAITSASNRILTASFGDFLFAPHGTASAARDNLLWSVNPRKRARLGLCQGLTQTRQHMLRIAFDCAGYLIYVHLL
jgi:hypothetical protein